MANKDIYHDHVRNALIKDDWTITHEFLRISVGMKDLYIDLGAQRLIGAEKGTQKIAVEVKSYNGPQKLDHMIRYRKANHVGGLNDKTTTIHSKV